VSFLTTVRFLTVLPVGQRYPSGQQLARSQGFFPLVGLLLGLVLAGVDVGLGLIWPGALTSAFLVVILLVLTGAMHLEGFLDSCDGLLGGRDRSNRLKIMRDRHVGAFAVAGGIGLMLLKWAALFSLPRPARFPVLVLFPVLSRWSMALVLPAFPYARDEGLGLAFHREATWTRTGIAAGTALVASVLFSGIGGVLLLVIVSLIAWLVGMGISQLLGGLTGDAYGAINEISEVVALAAGVALAPLGLIESLPQLLGAL
jgi:adenosylcobinamide-GDP ribazoletransferase